VTSTYDVNIAIIDMKHTTEGLFPFSIYL